MFQILYVVVRTLYSSKRLVFTAIALAFTFSVSANPTFADAARTAIWLDLEQRGSSALDANEYWLAEPTLKKALTQANKIQPKDIHLAQTLGELGRLCTIRGRYEEAEAYYEEELNVKREVWDNDKSKCIPTMGALIRFYLLHGTQDQALPLTAELLYYVEGKLDAAKEGSIKNSLKKGQPLQGWLGSAAPVAINPIIEWAVTCDAVGNSYLTLGNYQMADRFFKAALDVKTTVLGKNHLSLANSYDSLGTVYLEKKDLVEAESYYTDALDITEKTLGQGCHEAFNRLDKLAKVLIQEGKYPQAEALYLRAKNYTNNESSTSCDQARALYALGSLYTQEHKYDAAAPLLQQALQLAEKFNGPDSYAVVPYLQKYAYALYYLGRKPEMEQMQARASTLANAGM
jgi:tetratricopeptide (TPR) repeat protein